MPVPDHQAKKMTPLPLADAESTRITAQCCISRTWLRDGKTSVCEVTKGTCVEENLRKKGVQVLIFLSYPARMYVVAFLAIPLFVKALLVLTGGMSEYDQVRFIEQFDVLHNLFFALIPAALLLLFFPIKPVDKRSRPRIAVVGVFAFAVGILPLFTLCFSRDPYIFSKGVLLGCAYILLNVAGLVFAANMSPESLKKIFALMRNIPIVADASFPILVWAGYDKRLWVFRRPLRLVPVFMILLPCVFMATINVQPEKSLPKIALQFSMVPTNSEELVGAGYYDLQVDGDGALLATEGESSLVRFSPPDFLKTEQVELPADGSYGISLDSGSGIVTLLTQNDWKTSLVILDSKTLQIKREEIFTQHMQRQNGCMLTLYDKNRDICIGATEGVVVSLLPGQAGISRIRPDAYFACLDPNRRRFYSAHRDFGLFLSNDADTLKVDRWFPLPKGSERSAIDPVSDRCLLSYPVEGMIRVIDLDKFKVEKEIRSFFGVRTLWVDEKRRLIFAGGLTPFIEIRNADTLAFLDRIVAPPWQRDFATDPNSNILYVSSAHGIFKAEFSDRDGYGFFQRIKKYDPFFLMFQLINPTLLRLMNIDIAPGDAKNLPPEPVVINDGIDD